VKKGKCLCSQKRGKPPIFSGGGEHCRRGGRVCRERGRLQGGGPNCGEERPTNWGNGEEKAIVERELLPILMGKGAEKKKDDPSAVPKARAAEGGVCSFKEKKGGGPNGCENGKEMRGRKGLPFAMRKKNDGDTKTFTRWKKGTGGG